MRYGADRGQFFCSGITQIGVTMGCSQFPPNLWQAGVAVFAADTRLVMATAIEMSFRRILLGSIDAGFRSVYVCVCVCRRLCAKC